MARTSSRRGVATQARFATRLIVTLVASTGLLAFRQVDPASVALPSARAEAGFPSGFLENKGQWDDAVRYIARQGAAAVKLGRTGLLVCLQDRSHVGSGQDGAVTLALVGAGSGVNLVPSALLPGECHFLLGSSPSGWHTGVRRFAQVTYPAWSDGVDVQVSMLPAGVALRLRGLNEKSLGGVRLQLRGAISLSGANDGSLRGTTPAGAFVLSIGRPVAESTGASIAGPWRLGVDRDGRVMLDRDTSVPAVSSDLDLQLIWSTYLGGTHVERVQSMTLDASERPIVVGRTQAADFPTTRGAFDQTWSGGAGSIQTDAFVTCLTADGDDLVFSTFLGGSGNDECNAVLVEDDGTILLAGQTFSLDYPTTPGAFDPTGGGKGFISRLSADGSDLVASTALGPGQGSPSVDGLAIHPRLGVVACGETLATGFPTTPDALKPVSEPDPWEGGGVLVILSPALDELVYGTYLGAGLNESARSVAVRPDGTIAVAGRTGYPAFPTTPGAFDTALPAGTLKAFCLVLDVEAGELVYSTFIDKARPNRIRAHSDGSILMAGQTVGQGATFPATPGAFDTTFAGADDGFVLRLDPTGGSLIYATFLGSAALERIWDMTIDSAARATVVGTSWGPNYPKTPGAFSTGATGVRWLNVTRLNPLGTKLVYSMSFNTDKGISDEDGGIALHADGSVTIAASTNSQEYPVTRGAYDTTPPPGISDYDAVVSRFTLQPAGVLAFGASTPGPAGPLAIGVTSMPSLGNAEFGLTCTSAPVGGARGFALVTLGGLEQPQSVHGAGLWVDRSMMVLLLPLQAGADGYVEHALPLPAQPVLAGLVTYWQCLWVPSDGAPWSASNAMRVTIQP